MLINKAIDNNGNLTTPKTDSSIATVTLPIELCEKLVKYKKRLSAVMMNICFLQTKELVKQQLDVLCMNI